jgi:hypothetical protein
MKPTVTRALAVVLAALCWGSASAFAQAAPPLVLAAGDVSVEKRPDGYHLFIRQVPGAASVLLTEAFEPPGNKLATFAFRAVGPNPTNDGEKRLLNGKFLDQPHHSLVSSTPQPFAGGQAFEIVIPPVVEYGYPNYPNSRYDKIDVQKALSSPGGTFWFSVRTFSKPYADYSGEYKETAFELTALLAQTRLQAPVPTLSRFVSKDEQDEMARLHQLLNRGGDSLDLVVAIATNVTMTDYLASMRAHLVDFLRGELKAFKTYRVGLVFYRDYLEDYLTRSVAFTDDLHQVQKDLDSVEAAGGGAPTLAVMEALAAGLNNFVWSGSSRLLILLGDKPEHPTPRGNITEAMVSQWALDKKVELQIIELPLKTGP